HDGHDPLDEAISALTGPGKIVCVAAGNCTGLSSHAEWNSTASGQTGNVVLNIPTYTRGAGDVINIEGWYDPNVSYTVSLVTPTGQVIGPLARGGIYQGQTASGYLTVRNAQYTS